LTEALSGAVFVNFNKGLRARTMLGAQLKRVFTTIMVVVVDPSLKHFFGSHLGG